MVTAACEGNRMVYGYRRVREVCKANGLSLGEKSIRTIMREEHLQPKMKRTKRYSSYKGETAHRPANRRVSDSLCAGVGLQVVRESVGVRHG